MKRQYEIHDVETGAIVLRFEAYPPTATKDGKAVIWSGIYPHVVLGETLGVNN